MFKQIVDKLYPGNARMAYSVTERVDLALRHSHNDVLVRQTANLIERDYHSTLSGDDLIKIWQDDEYPFASKYLATLWWGNKKRHASTVYAPENIQLMNNPQILDAMRRVQTQKDFGEAMSALQEVYQGMCEGGTYYIPQVGPAFFSKVLEYYFAAYPLSSNPEFLPIICDIWLCRAVYAEMTERGEISLRDSIFRSPTAFRMREGSTWGCYLDYINYFNCRVTELQAKFPDLSAYMLEGYLFSGGGRALADTIIGRVVPQDADDQEQEINPSPESGPAEYLKGAMYLQEMEPNSRKKLREVDFGHEIVVGEQHYFLFIGHKPTFHYCELLTKKVGHPITSFPRIQLLRANGFNKEGKDYIYQKIAEPYDEKVARKLLEEALALCCSDSENR